MIGIIDYQLMNKTLIKQRRKIINDCDSLYSHELSTFLYETFHDILTPSEYNDRFSENYELLESHRLGYKYSKYI